MSHLARLSIALLVSTLAACGGKSNDPGDGGDGGTGAGGSGSGGGHVGGTGTGGGSVCASFDDDYPASVNVSILNQTNATLFVGQNTVSCGVEPPFAVADAAGTPLPALQSCRFSCAIVRTQGEVGCPDICAFPSTIALQPNEAFYTTWDGLYDVDRMLPAKCAPAAGAQNLACNQAKRIEPGSFTFSANAGSALDCSQTSGTPACSACTPGPNGGCTTPGGVIGGVMHHAETNVLLDESFGIYPSAPAASTSAGDAAPAPGGAQAIRSVEIIFTN